MSFIPTTRIVQELLNYLSKNPDLKAAFETSFNNAYTEHPGLDHWAKFDVHSVDNYFRYMDEFVCWVPTENCQGTDVYNHLNFFFFILDTSPLREYQSPIHPSSRSPWTWLSEWLIRYAKDMGLWMDSPGSFDPKKIETFAKSAAYRDQGITDFYDQYPKPDGGWKTFNEFFGRHINPKYRPIDGPDDPTVIVCPADCAFSGKWTIQDDSKVQFSPDLEVDVKVKGVPWSIRQLLDDGSSNLHSVFSGGVFTHAFLNTTNYHRMHAPVSGKVVLAKVIPGLCYVEIEAEREPASSLHAGPSDPKEHLTMRRRPTLPNSAAMTSMAEDITVPNSPGYQFIQTRGLVLIESEIGLVAVLPVGMAQVSSIVLSVKEGDAIKKGQEIGFFQLGGSDIVMVFEKDADVNLDQWKPSGVPGKPDLQEKFTKMGSKIGTATPFQAPGRGC